MRLYHYATREVVERIRQSGAGLRDVHYVVEAKVGVWLCGRGLHRRPGQAVLVVNLPNEVLREEWRTFCAADPRESDWVIPAAVLTAYGVVS